MNWEQLYTTATPAEREEILISMFQAIEARQMKIILARGRLRRERRRVARLHFVNERRLMRSRLQRTRSILFKGIFLFIFSTMSIATCLIAVSVHPKYSVAIMLYYLASLMGMFLVKPLVKRLKVAKLNIPS